MCTRFFSPSLIITLLAIFLAGCAGPASPTAPTEMPIQTSPLATEGSAEDQAPQAMPTEGSEVIMAMVEDLNAGDVEGSLAFFADDARVYLYGLPPTGYEYYQGKDQIRALYEDSVANHFQWEVEISYVSGDEFHVRANTWHDFTRQLGVAPLQYEDVYQISDGKITTYASWITAEALSRFKPAFLEVFPPEPPASPSTAPGGTDLTITFEDGNCTTDFNAPLAAGEIAVNVDVKDQDKLLYALILFTLDPGKDMLDAMASTFGLPPEWMHFVLYKEIEPGQRATYQATADEGPVYGICFAKPPDVVVGSIGPFQVQSNQITIEPTPTIAEGPASAMTLSLSSGVCKYTGPMSLKLGEVTVTMDVKDQNSYALTFFTLDPGKTLQDLVASQGMAAPPPWANMFSMQDNIPGESKTYSISVEEGPVYLLCWSSDRVIKSMGPFEVEP